MPPPLQGILDSQCSWAQHNAVTNHLLYSVHTPSDTATAVTITRRLHDAILF